LFEIEFLENVNGVLTNNELQNGRVNTALFLIIKEFSSLNDESKSAAILDTLEIVKSALDELFTINASQQLTPLQTYNAKKIFFYFINLCIRAEQFKNQNSSIQDKSTTKKSSKKKTAANSKDTAFDWIILRKTCLTIFKDIVSYELGLLWNMHIVEESFLQYIWSYLLDLLIERPLGIAGTAQSEIQTRQLCIQIIGQIIKHFGSISTSGSYSALSTAMVHALTRYEHMTMIIAEICKYEKYVTKLTMPSVTQEIMLEMNQMTMNHHHVTTSNQTTKNIALFLESFAEIDPETFSNFLPQLITLIDASAHQLRSAMIQCITCVIAFIHKQLTSKKKVFPAKLDEEKEAEKEVEKEAEKEARDNQKSMNPQQAYIRQRDDLLNLLIERTHDMNPYTRAALLKHWTFLITQQAIPVKRFGHVAEVGVDRLQDKNSLVRRQAMILLSMMLEYNPFTGKLYDQVFDQQKQELQKQLEDRMKELTENVLSQQLQLQNKSKTATKEEEAEDDDDDNNNEETVKNSKKQKSNKKHRKGKKEELLLLLQTAKDNDVEEEEEEVEEEEQVEEDVVLADAKTDDIMQELQKKYDYIVGASEFIHAIQKSLPQIAHLLESKNTTDVIESLHFLGRAIHFQVHHALEYFNNSFKLIWHTDTHIKQEVQSVFLQVYFMQEFEISTSTVTTTSDELEATTTTTATTTAATTTATTKVSMASTALLSPIEIIHNLTKLIQSCTDEQLVSFEEILTDLPTQLSSSSQVTLLLDTLVNHILQYHTSTSTSSSLFVLSSKQREWTAQLQLFSIFSAIFHGKLLVDYVSSLYQNILVYTEHYQSDKDTNIDREDNNNNSNNNNNNNNNEQYQNDQELGELSSLLHSHQYAAIKYTLQALARIYTSLTSTSPSPSSLIVFPMHIYHQLLLQTIPGILFYPMELTSYPNTRITMTDDYMKQWCSLAEEAIHILFVLHPSPERMIQGILYQWFSSLSQVTTTSNYHCPAYILAAFFFLLGQTALNTVVYVEEIGNLVKKQIREDMEQKTTNMLSNNNSNDNDNNNPMSSIVGQEEAIIITGKKTGSKKKKNNANDSGEVVHSTSTNSSNTIANPVEGNIGDFEEQMGVAAAMDAEHDQVSVIFNCLLFAHFLIDLIYNIYIIYI
jgi:hypothetical protein